MESDERIIITIKALDKDGKWKKRDISVPVTLPIKDLRSAKTWKRMNGELIDTSKSFEENNIFNGELIELI